MAKCNQLTFLPFKGLTTTTTFTTLSVKYCRKIKSSSAAILSTLNTAGAFTESYLNWHVLMCKKEISTNKIVVQIHQCTAKNTYTQQNVKMDKGNGCQYTSCKLCMCIYVCTHTFFNQHTKEINLCVTVSYVATLFNILWCYWQAELEMCPKTIEMLFTQDTLCIITWQKSLISCGR